MKRYPELALLAIMITGSAQAIEVYTGVGTTGLTLGLDQALSQYHGLRVDANGFNYNRSFDSGNMHYDGKLKLRSAGFYYDFHPFAGSFRLTAGALVGNDKVSATGTSNSNGTYTINGQQYSAAGSSIHADAKFPTVRPYLGIGGGQNDTSKGLGFFWDVGVAYGKPSVTYTASQSLVDAAGQSNIDEEKRQLQDKMDKLRYYPVVRLGISYAF